MSLTGPVVLWLSWLAALGIFAWIVLVWPRAAGPGIWMVLRRVGSQLGVVVLVVLAVGVSLNDSYGWYANWADLGTMFTGDAPAGEVVAAGAAASSAAAIAPGPARPTATLDELASRADRLHLVANPGPGGQYRDFEIPGPAGAGRGRLTVWFPASYAQSQNATHRYPVLEAFHGIPGSPHQFSVALGLGATVAGQVAAGHLADTVVVMPDYFPLDKDTECVNGGPGGVQMEDWLVHDVTAWVDANLRVSTDRTDWATLGFSAGAYCASALAMLHPLVFSAAISLGGYFEPTFESNYFPFHTHSARAQRYNLIRLAHDAPPPVALWVETSAVDRVSYATTSALLAQARAPLSVTADVLPNAGHRVSVWNALIPQTLQWLGRTAPGFRPGPLGTGH